VASRGTLEELRNVTVPSLSDGRLAHYRACRVISALLSLGRCSGFMYNINTKTNRLKCF
jgi:hypothetical protein